MKASLSVSIIIAWAATFQRMNWPHLVTQLELGGGGGVIPEGPHLWAPILVPEVASKDKRKPGGPSFFSVPCFSDVRAGVDLEEGWERGGTWVRAWQEMSWAKP